MADPLPGGLAEHLLDAIRLNRSRRASYRQRGGWRADVLSRLLVGTERALLLAAPSIDRQVARYEIPLLPLADMTDVPTPDSPLPPISPEGPGGSAISAQRRIWRTLMACDLDEACLGLAQWHWTVRHRGQRHQALTLHVLESAMSVAGAGAMAGRSTGGETLRLSRRLILGHLALIPFARGLDRLAAPLHRRGVGLFVNDLPPVPTS